MLGMVFGVILLELMIVGWVDFRRAKISNNWILVNVVLSILSHLFLRPLYPLGLEVLIFPVGFVIFGFCLFLMGIMGAGDSKFLASLFLIVPLEYHMIFFERLVLTTIVMGLCLVVIRTIKNRTTIRAYLVSQYWSGIRSIFRSSFSYAPVIFMAWIFTGLTVWK